MNRARFPLCGFMSAEFHDASLRCTRVYFQVSSDAWMDIAATVATGAIGTKWHNAHNVGLNSSTCRRFLVAQHNVITFNIANIIASLLQLA